MRCTQPLHRSVLVSPNAICTRLGDREHSFAQVADRVARLAGGLQSLGMKMGDRVAILSLNSDRYYESLYAVPWGGGVVVPLNIRWSVAELLYSLKDSGADYLLVDDTFLDTARAVVAGLEQPLTLISMGETICADISHYYEKLIEESSPVEDFMRDNDDLFGIFYTGGTTGFPKGVMLSHRNFYSSAMALMTETGINSEPDGRYLHAAPMFHIADCAIGMANSIAGNTHVFIPAFDPVAVMDTVSKNEITIMLLVPTMIGMVLSHKAFDARRLASVQRMIYGASPMPEGILRRALENLPSVEFYQAYGQTELAPMASVLSAQYHSLAPEADFNKLRSAGKPSLIVEIKVVDTEGKSLPRNEPGEVLVRGPNAMLGYWNNPEQTTATLVNGWVHTGDAGYLDDEGFLFLVDRVKDMIVSGGENVFSAEVENVISQLGGVEQVAVIGIPSNEWGEAVHAVIYKKAGVDLSEDVVLQHCRNAIARYKCPRSIEFRQEPLPMTSVGKLSKKDLRKPYWEGKTRAIN